MVKNSSKSSSLSHFLLEGLCFVSVIGIWPRYIEPRLLSVTNIKIPFPVKREIKIVVLSDLHLGSYTNNHFIEKLIGKVKEENPDLILWVGDFICQGKVFNHSKLKQVLTAFNPSLGSFAVFGNHDYSPPLLINDQGDYDSADIASSSSPLKRGFLRLFKAAPLTKRVTESAKQTQANKELIALLKECKVTLLDNHSVQIADQFNLLGVGEHMGGKIDLEKAYANYQPHLPGIVMAHNPDAIPQLLKQSGDVIFCGHTHGGQINLPFLWKRFTVMENLRYKKGLIKEKGKTIYISRGLGGVIPFRFNAVPEIVSVTLKSK